MDGKMLLLAGTVLGISRMCIASTPEAWEEFQSLVRIASEALAENLLFDIDIAVDPYGSESYGIAILHGTDRSSAMEAVYITVYDKSTGGIEISGEFLPSELAWWCGLEEENHRLRQALAALKNDR